MGSKIIKKIFTLDVLFIFERIIIILAFPLFCLMDDIIYYEENNKYNIIADVIGCIISIYVWLNIII